MTVAITRRAVIRANGLVLLLGAASLGASATTRILFIGNSFTYGEGSVVMSFQPGTVKDLNGGAIGGLPALFKAFTTQAGLSYEVSLETVSGSGLDLHHNTKQVLINKPWDRVVMHTFSTLDASAPGNPAQLIRYASLLAQMVAAQNPQVKVDLMATWSRADQTYPSRGAWHGRSIYQMGEDVDAAYRRADEASPQIQGVIPVGLAWNRAMRGGIADLNPYDGIDPGKLTLWANDHYHASKFGSYLAALTVFGHITGLDPRSLGPKEHAGAALGISAAQVQALQKIAHEQLTVRP